MGWGSQESRFPFVISTASEHTAVGTLGRGEKLDSPKQDRVWKGLQRQEEEPDAEEAALWSVSERMVLIPLKFMMFNNPLNKGAKGRQLDEQRSCPGRGFHVVLMVASHGDTGPQGSGMQEEVCRRSSAASPLGGTGWSGWRVSPSCSEETTTRHSGCPWLLLCQAGARHFTSAWLLPLTLLLTRVLV